MEENGTPVTRSELSRAIMHVEEQLEKVPTRWEVRCLILIGFFGTALIPTADIAQAAINALPF